MENAYDYIEIDLTKEETEIAEAYAEKKGITVEKAVKTAFFDMIDDWVDNYSEYN